MRVIKKSEVRKIIIGHVELTLIFLFDYLLCKIAILESLKVLFLDKKQKLLSVDGNFNGDLTRLDRSGLAKTLLDLRDANFDNAELSIGE